MAGITSIMISFFVIGDDPSRTYNGLTGGGYMKDLVWFLKRKGHERSQNN